MNFFSILGLYSIVDGVDTCKIFDVSILVF